MGTFKEKIKDLWLNEEGMGTLEILLIIAVLVVIALLFREKIIGWVSTLLEKSDTQINQF
ncbi:MAG: Flp1 family type IVb pilin [Arcobacteraceae bacterium]|jgi:hypothetical protein|nr:Flp1 family type IVb pilin [Arcobacteraceae bacterium]